MLLLAAADSLVCAESVNFNQNIRPLLSDRCFPCHGPDKEHRKAKLRLDVEADAKAEVIVAGNADQSEFFKRLIHPDAEERMPPEELGKPLSSSKIELIRRWIQEGASWSEHWAYVAPKRHPLPEVKDKEWPSNWIDRFVLGRLEEESLQPSPDTDKVTLLRRVSFDLTGLPPSAEDVHRFVHDSDPKAYERYIDRLLSSHHFGNEWPFTGLISFDLQTRSGIMAIRLIPFLPTGIMSSIPSIEE